MKIFLGADHAGFELKNRLKDRLEKAGYGVVDCGALSLDKEDDYPAYAYAVATKVLGEEDGRGILICGSGQGMSIAANRLNGVRAALAWNEETARAGKTDDDSNILVLPSRYIEEGEALKAVDTWLKAEFKNDPKYRRRLDELGDIRA